MLNRAKDAFLATLSHELRTPLTAMLGWARLLRSGKLDDAGRERAVQTIERNTKLQVQLIDDLLDVSRIVSGKLRLEVGAVDLGAVIEGIIESMRPAAEAKGVSIHAALDPKARVVEGDAGRLGQIVSNLLSNAVKFTPEAGRVDVRLELVNGQTRVVVSDTGKGIAPQLVPYVFDRFRQADSTTTRAHGGLGLGLAIVHHLVELHGGTVHVASAGEGQGSTFTVRLPLMFDAAKGDLRPERVSAPTPAAGAEPLMALAGRRILVVDDEPDAREFVTAVLEQHGAKVRTVASARDALTALKSEMPDVLVSDIAMPGQDGRDLIREVRQLEHERGGAIPAVAITAHAHAESRGEALSAGFDAYLPKPLEPQELAAVVSSVLQRGARVA
ncbi:MAG: response regulator [Candidatus Rokubacteria bacterium]|nr:response regulator [Candidatus Rokubacteria bacterium]